MKYRVFPGTSLEVSVVGMGCWAIGGKWWGDDVRDSDSIAAVHAALECGVNFFDTAPLYGHGHADEILLQALGSKRHDVVIATKVGVRLQGAGGHAQSDLSATHVREDVEASLRRLELEQIPLLQIHWPCEMDTPPQETMETLLELQHEGKVAHIGACNYNHRGLSELLQHGPLTSLQTPLSMVRSRFEPALQDLCSGDSPATNPIGVIGYEPLCRGLLTGKYRVMTSFPPGDVRAQDDWFKGARFLRVLGLVRVLDKVAEKVKTSLPTLAVAWSANRPGVTTSIVGAKRAEQIQETADASDLLEHPRLWPVLNRIVDEYPPI